MIPTMIAVGVILGRWWRATLLLAAVGWPAVLVADNVMEVEAGLLAAAALGVLNAGVGILIHQTFLGLLRRIRRASAR